MVAAEVRGTGQERNVASVTTAGSDPHLRNNLSRAATKVRPILVLRKTASVRSVRVGQDVRYRLAVGNPTSIAVGHVTVCDRLPTALVFVAADPAARLSVGRYCFTVRSLRAHGSRSFTLVANAAPGHSGRVVNTATATAPGARAARAAAIVKVIAPPPEVCVVGSARAERGAASRDGSRTRTPPADRSGPWAAWSGRCDVDPPLDSVEEIRSPSRFSITTLTTTIDVCSLSELAPGQKRLVRWEDLEIGVFNCAGTVYAIEDRCTHDDGPLVEGGFDEQACTVECPRHGSLFDLKTGKPKTLPAYVPVDTFPVIIEDDTIKLEVE